MLRSPALVLFTLFLVGCGDAQSGDAANEARPSENSAYPPDPRGLFANMPDAPPGTASYLGEYAEEFYRNARDIRTTFTGGDIEGTWLAVYPNPRGRARLDTLPAHHYVFEDDTAYVYEVRDGTRGQLPIRKIAYETEGALISMTSFRPERRSWNYRDSEMATFPADTTDYETLYRATKDSLVFAHGAALATNRYIEHQKLDGYGNSDLFVRIMQNRKMTRVE